MGRTRATHAAHSLSLRFFSRRSSQSFAAYKCKAVFSRITLLPFLFAWRFALHLLPAALSAAVSLATCVSIQFAARFLIINMPPDAHSK